MRLSIERLRMLVLVAGVLLVLALAGFLAINRWKSRFKTSDIPQRLGINIQQESDGVTYTKALGGRTAYKLHASRVTKLKDGYSLLHDVKIELYGADGSRVDRIEGQEFEYDERAQTAKATGPVEIWLMRPDVAPAIAPKAAAGTALGQIAKGHPLASAAQAASSGEMHVKTSGLVFDRKTGLVQTAERVDFSTTQASGSAIGATYKSDDGRLLLDHAVELTSRRGADAIHLHAGHAEFDRNDQVCRLLAASAEFQGANTSAAEARILFRDDGSVERLDASNGFSMTTADGGRVASPAGQMDFDKHNQPRHGHLTGGVAMDSMSALPGAERRMHGAAPQADLDFTEKGELRHAHLERGVVIDSQEQSLVGAEQLRVSRHWRSPLADIEFRKNAQGKMAPASIHGVQGVTVSSESQRGSGATTPSKLVADELTGEFGAGSGLTAMRGIGHTVIEQTSDAGTRQTTSGDRFEAHFAPPGAEAAKPGARHNSAATQIDSAVVDGHVVLIETPAPRQGGPALPLRATAGRAVYEGSGEWLHLTAAPRVDDGGLQVTADRIDISQASGDAFAHSNVKASWTGAGADPGARQGIAFGGQGPVHAISAEAQLHQATGEVTFRSHARLWQQANSISAPAIVLDRMRQTLVARTTDRTEPVKAVLVSASTAPQARAKAAAAAPQVVRVAGGDLKYSEAERKALMRGGAFGPVTAETGAATVTSSEVELQLLPSGNHAGKDGASAQVDRLTARGSVVLTSQGRRGTGEQLVYNGETGEYVLTGTAATPPRMSDPGRGTVSGTALIFHSGDDSVSIEGGGRKTTAETTAPK